MSLFLCEGVAEAGERQSLYNNFSPTVRAQAQLLRWHGGVDRKYGKNNSRAVAKAPSSYKIQEWKIKDTTLPYLSHNKIKGGGLQCIFLKYLLLKLFLFFLVLGSQEHNKVYK